MKSVYKTCTNIYCHELQNVASYSNDFKNCDDCGSRLAPISNKLEADMIKLKSVMQAMDFARKQEAAIYWEEQTEEMRLAYEASLPKKEEPSFEEQLEQLNNSISFQDWKDNRK